MKRIFALLLVTLTCSFIYGQKKPYFHPKYDLKYEIQGSGGRNGLSVTYNKSADIYYCVFAGNSSFPLESFSNNGSPLEDTKAGQDMRGLWYNPKSKKLEGIIYNYGGVFEIEMRTPQKPGLPNIRAFNFQQPSAQAVGVFNPKKKEIYCFFNGYIHVFDHKKLKKKKEIELKNSPVTMDYISPYSMIYTGYKNYEFGLYDFYNGKVHLFKLNGEYTHSMTFPENAPNPDVFCFAFANDRVWLFDTDYRTWYGYKAFY